VSEEPHPRSDELDTIDIEDFLALMNDEDRRAVEVVRDQVPVIARTVELIAGRLRDGGRLRYFGAGTSGRLAELDAIECGPTFGIDPQVVVAYSAGDGEAEDDSRRGLADAQSAGLVAGDVVVAVSASGTTGYVLAAAREAQRAGALVVAVTCAPGSQLAGAADVAVELAVGAEVIAGSSRLKAGTAQKVVLNMLSTGVFTRLGHTYRGRMVGVAGANEKQRRRALKLVTELTGESAADAEGALQASQWNAKVAVLMLRRGLSPAESASILAKSDGDLAAALGERASA
jgi:N-acetylmuramic acid 6-phosphate etherase